MFDTPYELVPLSMVVGAKETRDPRKSPDEWFDYIDISSVSNATYSITASKRLCGADAPSRARKVMRAGDVIFATTRPYLKAVAAVPEELEGQLCSTGFCVLRPSDRIISEWLFYCAISEEIQQHIKPLMRGATYPAVTDKDVLDALVPLPPTSEQLRIVGRVKECMERAEEIEFLQDTICADLEHLPIAVRYDLWKEWASCSAMAALEDIVESTKNGLYKPSKHHGQGVVLLRMFNVNGATFDLSRTERLEVTEREATDYAIRNGDIIVSRVNSRELVGKSALVDGLEEPAVHEAMLIRLRVDPELVDTRFLVSMMNAPQFLHDLRVRAKHAIGQSSINQRDLLSSVIPLPSIEQQRAVIDSAATTCPLIESLARENQEKREIAAGLRNAILRKAFAGEL